MTEDTPPPTIQMLWIEGRLSRLERLSLASFIACGHPVDLYTYGLDNDPPAGVRVLDAAQIVPTSRRFRFQGVVGYGSLASFADLFRFTLLLERGGIWCDADLVCLKPLLFARDMPMFFSSETARESDVSGTVRFVPLINNGACKVSPGHRLMELCIEKHERALSPNMRWGDSGPGALRAAVRELGLTEYVLHPDVICPVHHWEVSSLLFGARTITPTAHAVHFWNEILRWNFFDKDETYDRHSLYERLARHYLADDAER